MIARHLLRGLASLVLVLVPIASSAQASSPARPDAGMEEALGRNDAGTAYLRDAREYGLSSTNTAAQNGVALESMRRDLVTHPGVEVHFVPGDYHYLGYQWLAGVQDVALVGYGARLICDGPGPDEKDTNPSLEFNIDLFAAGPSRSNRGLRFHTADVGDSRLRLVARADSSKVKVGDRVLLAGYDQQGSGAPPNERFFEYRLVTGIADGAVELDRGVENYYDERWPDVDYGRQHEGVWGAPRILDLETASAPFVRHLRLEGLTFVTGAKQRSNKNAPRMGGFGSVFLQGIDHVELRDVTVGDLTPSEIRYLEIDDSQIMNMELDKELYRVVIRNSEIKNMSEATGVQYLDVQGGRCTNCYAMARVQEWEGTVLDSASSLGVVGIALGSWAVKYAGYEHCYANRSRAQRDISPVNVGPDLTIEAPAGGGVRKTDGGASVEYFDVPIDAAFWARVAAPLDYGTRLRSESGNSGVVTGLYQPRPGMFRIEGSFARPPARGERFHFTQVQEIHQDFIDLRGRDLSIANKGAGGSPSIIKSSSTGGAVDRRVFPLPDEGRINSIPVRGYIHRVEVVVENPASTGAKMTIVTNCPDVPALSIDLSTRGDRVFTPNGHEGPELKGESHAPLGVCYSLRNWGIVGGNPDRFHGQGATGYILIETVAQP